MSELNLTKKKLSLGIPTFKRPENAIRIVKKALSMKIYDEIIVSSNSKEKMLSDFFNSNKLNGRLIFFEQQENVGLAFNYLKLIELCGSEYLHILSDEDLPNKKNTQKLYNKLSATQSKSIVITSVADKDGLIYKDASWQKNSFLKDLLGETAHIGSCLINISMLGTKEIKVLTEYCEREGSVYIGPAAALTAYSVGKNILYFPPVTVEMGEIHSVREISGYSIYGLRPRLDQYLNLFLLWKILELRNKYTIYFYILYYFSHHALQNAKFKFNENVTYVFSKFIKENKLSLSSKCSLFFLYVSFYIFYFYLNLRSFISKTIKSKKS